MTINQDNKDIFFLTLLQGMNYIIPIILMPYLMIKLGATSYGYLGFSMAVIQYFILFIDFGFNLSATKRIAIFREDKIKLSKVFFSTLYAKLIFLIISIFIFLFLLFIPAFKEYKIALLCSFITVIGNTFTFNWLYQGIGKIRLLSVMSMVSRLLILPSIFFIVKSPQDYPQAIFIQSLVYIFTALISGVWLLKNNIIQRLQISFKNVKLEVKESFPLFLSSASISIYTQLFVVILGLTTTPTAVGRYSAAEKIMRSLSFLFYTPISQVYYPKIANLSILKKDEALDLLANIIKFTIVIMIIISFSLFFGGSVLEMFLGSDYYGIKGLLKILSPVPIAIVFGGIIGQLGLIALGDNKSKRDFQRVYFMAAPFSLITVLILSYFFYENGAAIAVLLTEFLVAILMFHSFKKMRTFRLLHNFRID